MSKIRGVFSSLIGLKLTMAITGILLCGFLLTHVAANLLVLFDQEAFNFYSYKLTSNKALLLTAEAGLLFIFIVHLYTAIRVSILNKKAKPQRYAFPNSTGRSRRTWMSSNMMLSGSIILIFLVFHIKNFKFGVEKLTVQDGVQMRDLAYNVITDFSELSYVLIYVAAMIVLMFHLIHAVRSVFATLGLENSRFSKYTLWIGRVFTFGVGGGFLLIPLWIYFVGV